MKITGETGTTGQFGNAFATGDFNGDGKTDLAVGASAYSSTGRVYLLQRRLSRFRRSECGRDYIR
jgi:hypothetical protein